MRTLSLLLLGLLLGACSRTPSDAPEERIDTLSRFDDGSPKQVEVRRGDSLIERRTYRPTGFLFKVARNDTVHSYFDLHDSDSAAVLQDYLQGRWRNLSADTTREEASVFYVFADDRLTFESPSRSTLESMTVEYKDERTLVTETGMAVRPQIASFDTVEVTGYTLVRSPPTDSL